MTRHFGVAAPRPVLREGIQVIDLVGIRLTMRAADDPGVRVFYAPMHHVGRRPAAEDGAFRLGALAIALAAMLLIWGWR